MSLVSLQLFNFRNFCHYELELHPKCNLFYGHNGVGKTSILEAIYFLGLGRSFRSRSLRHVIHHNADKFTVVGKCTAANQLLTIGIAKTLAGDSQMRIAGTTVNNAELAQLLPIQLINQNAFRIFESGPKVRRQFLDWGVFHVEPSFLTDWRKVERILQHRNSLLRSQDLTAIQLWDNELCRFAEQLQLARAKYFALFLPVLHEVLAELLPQASVLCEYYPGWDIAKGLPQVLTTSLMRDCKLGYTQHGPHRADLLFTIQGIPAQEVLSRGQQKMFLIALRLAQGVLLSRDLAKQSIYLLDDLGAELDATRRHMVAKYLCEMYAQVFVTGLAEDQLAGFDIMADKKMFHVEHSSVTGSLEV